MKELNEILKNKTIERIEEISEFNSILITFTDGYFMKISPSDRCVNEELKIQISDGAGWKFEN